MQKRSRMPRDTNQLASMVVKMATGQAEPEPEGRAKNPAAVALGKLGGPKGGKNRWKGVSAKKRTELTRKAAVARWKRG